MRSLFNITTLLFKRSVNSIVISGDGSFVCAGGADSVVRVWNLMSSHAYELEADEPVTVEASTV